MNQSNIAWVTDSTATLSTEFIEKHNIYVVPLFVIFGETAYKENVEISSSEFYKKLASVNDLPKTSQPSPGEMLELFNEIKNKYKHVIAIHATGALTGAYSGAVSATKEAGVDAFVLDSQIGSFPLGKMVERAVALEQQGKTFEEIVTEIKTLPAKGRLFLTPGSLEQLHKGGRVTGSQAVFATLLNMKVVLKFHEGRAVLSDKVRSHKRAIAKMADYLEAEKNHVKEVTVLHADNLKEATQLKKELQTQHPQIIFSTTELSPVPGTHTGRGTVGLAWLGE
ncbi:DegV family protein [Paenisporosarcina sp. FSL H8-0542]|uniref:DegV family protein n=1 Tax=unclassified Paenisporosarcina TaxID=2642018 RepID=UPI00034E57B1|nr:DegV family protein [Paenisporosarcina sp. HGH0030]EPD51440.1 DegV family EDD domain-containing protein [Paenisporosarcina sp. HGH0030]